MKKSYSILLSAFLLMVFSSCLKDTIDELSEIKGFQATGSFSAPLINSSITLRDIYESYSETAFIKERSDNLLVFVYRSQDTISAEDTKLEFPSTSSDFELQMTAQMIGIFNSTGSIQFSIDDSIILQTPNNEQVKRLSVKAGTFEITFVSEYKHDIKVIINYPSITQNGVPVSEVVTVNYDPLDYPKTVTRTLDLRGYDIDFTRGGVTVNSLPFVYNVEVTRLENSATLPSEKLSINQKFTIDGYNFIQGYLGRYTILDEPSVIDIDLFANSTQGEVYVNDPRVVIRLFNTYGVPVTATISDLKVIDYNNNPYPVIIAPFQDTFSFVNASVPGQIGVSEFKIDKSNSNINDVINTRPKQMTFRIKMEANYREEVVDNFMVDTALFAVDFDSEIPFDLKIVGYVSETKETNGTFSNMSSNIQEVKLEVKTENELPFDLSTQMVFTRDSILSSGDTLNIAIDSLFNVPLFVPGAKVDANGDVVQSSVRLNTVSLSLDKYKRMQSAPFHMLRMKASTSPGANGEPSFVKVRTNLKLSMKVGGDIKVTYKSN